MEKISSGYRTAHWQKGQPMARRRIDTWPVEDNLPLRQSRSVPYIRKKKDTVSLLTILTIASVAAVWFAAMIWVGVNSMRANVERHMNPAVAVQPSATPAPVLVEKQREKPTTNILLLGSDQRAGDSGFRTDVILLVSINKEQRTVNVVSFPRDLWVEASGLWGMKINMVLGLGGYESLIGTFEESFGVRPDYYLLTNFDGFTGIIDSLDGVDVEVAETLTDDCDLPQQRDGDCTVEPGTVHMDGATALWYVRSRYTTSDIDRMRRMQEVMAAVFDRLMRMEAMRRIPQMYEQFSSSVETNMVVSDILPLLQYASAAFRDTERIQRHTINEEYATEMLSWDGMWILLPDLEAVQSMLREEGVE